MLATTAERNPMDSYTFPKLHNSLWSGLVGKGPDSEPPIGLDTMLDLTAAAEVDGIKFDGVDLFLFAPHVSIDATKDELVELADKVSSRNLVVGSVVAPVWPATDGGSAMGNDVERKKFLAQVEKSCRLAHTLSELGVRPHGIVRIDSAVDPVTWARNSDDNSRRIAETFKQACDIAEHYGERLAAEGEICWGGMQSWAEMVRLLELVDRPRTLGFQADMAHTLLYLLGHNAPQDRILPDDWQWEDPEVLDESFVRLTAALRPWTIDFHVAQNDATVKGSGSHDKTGRHCLPNDPNGKLDIIRHASYWLRDEHGNLTKSCRHICWDGCMFSNKALLSPETWNDILQVLIQVRQKHGWSED
jgi:hypothetical protein